jgi:hypothetical protein
MGTKSGTMPRVVARASSLRAELSPVVENAHLAGAAGTVVSAAMVAAFLGPLGFLLLAFLPVNLTAAVLVHRRRMRLRDEAVAIARGAGRGIATVEVVEASRAMIGGQRRRRVRARVEPIDGGPSFETESVVYWTAAEPGATGIAAWHDPGDVLLYFAEGPENPVELERALNRETGQYSREPVL